MRAQPRQTWTNESGALFLPHGVVDTVGLGQEEEVVPGHVEEVRHEGDLRDGQPELPGEEIIDDTSVSAAAGESHPEQTEAPGGLAESEIGLGLHRCISS